MPLLKKHENLPLMMNVGVRIEIITSKSGLLQNNSLVENVEQKMIGNYGNVFKFVTECVVEYNKYVNDYIVCLQE